MTGLRETHSRPTSRRSSSPGSTPRRPDWSSSLGHHITDCVGSSATDESARVWVGSDGTVATTSGVTARGCVRAGGEPPRRRDRPRTEPEALLSEAPLPPGTNGRKMSKSRINAIALAAGADDTTRRLRAARTDANPDITHNPEKRPEISDLILLTAIGERSAQAAGTAEIAGDGAAALRRRALDAVNERRRPVCQRRAELIEDRSQLRSGPCAGGDAARAGATEAQGGRRGMHTSYSPRSSVQIQRRLRPPCASGLPRTARWGSERRSRCEDGAGPPRQLTRVDRGRRRGHGRPRHRRRHVYGTTMLRPPPLNPTGEVRFAISKPVPPHWPGDTWLH